MKSSRNQSGFSALEVILVICVIALIGAVGWLVMGRHKASTTQSTNSSSSSNTSTTQSSSAVEIKEWGVKLVTTHANELTYSVSNKSGSLESNNEAFDSYATFAIKPDLLTDKECSPGVNLYRLSGTPTDSTTSIKIGNSYYTTFGAPGVCSNDTDTNLNSSIVSDITIANLKAL